MKIYPRVNTLSPDLIERYREISPATIGHYLNFNFMRPEIKPLFSNVKIVGTAFTVKIPTNDSTMLHKAMGMVGKGDVIVIDRMGDTMHSCVGEVIALAAKTKEVEGIIIDGPATDVVEIKKIGVPVFSTGLSVITTKLLGLDGEINTNIQCGGVIVKPGDLIFADDNGVLVIDPEEMSKKLLDLALEDEKSEVELKEKLLSGSTLPDLTKVDKLIENNLMEVIKKIRNK